MLADPMDIDRSKIRDIDLWDPALKASPGETLVKWSSWDPFYIVHGDVPQAVVTRFEDAKRALEDHESFSNGKRPWPGTEKYNYWQGLPVVTDTDPPAHTKLRRLLAPAFSPRRLAAVEHGVRAWIAARLDLLERGSGRFDLMPEFGRELSMHLLLGLLMDIRPEDRPRFVAVSDGLTMFASLPAGSGAPPAYLIAWESVRAYCEELIARRRREPVDDLVSNIITAHDDEARLTTDELFATFIILFVAGLSGIAHLIGWMIWRLCINPGQLALLRAQPELIDSAIEETLRIEPIGYTALRWTRDDIEMSGLRFLRNMPVMVVEGASSFDPERYEDPLHFDISRKPRRDSLNFGHGVHHCIGATVARMASRHAVSMIVARFPQLRLQDPHFRPTVVGGPKDRGPASMPVAI